MEVLGISSVEVGKRFTIVSMAILSIVVTIGGSVASCDRQYGFLPFT